MRQTCLRFSTASAHPATAPRNQSVALVMVLIVLSTLAVIGTPFVVSMLIQDRASKNFAGDVAARQAAMAARNHAIALLRRTAYPGEYAREAEILEAERPRFTVKKGQRRGSFRSRRGTVRRRDLGDAKAERRSRDRRDYRRGRNEEGRRLPEYLRESRKGPSEREYDTPDELESSIPDAIELPADAPEDPSVMEDGRRVALRSSRGMTASAQVTDEQSKINLNTAPPNLIASIFGVSQLARPLKKDDDVLFLDDISQFPGDSDPRTIDGAVVVMHPESSAVEAITYRRQEGDALLDCFRGDFFSLPLVEVFPAGSFVYDLRGWKIGFHRLWNERYGGFHPARLGEFRSVESIREIARWQIASLFLTRIRGAGLDWKFLRESGITERKLEKYGLDPMMFTGEASELSGKQMEEEYEKARKVLRKLRVSRTLLKKVEKERGPRVFIELASRLEGASSAEIKKITAEIAESLKADARKSIRISKRYLSVALEQLGDTYATPGLETILPEDLERHRDAFTVSSHVAVRWGEAQAMESDIPLTGPEYQTQVPRASDFNAGTVVGLRRRASPERSEFTLVAAAGGGGDRGGVRFAYPLRESYKAHEATIQPLQRHPVNANTASRKVLRAVFTGVRGPDKNHVVTPYEADQIAARVIGARPLKSHKDFHGLLTSAVKGKVIDDEDFEPLLVNAVQPTNYFLKVSTTGLCYSTGDVYEIESLGLLRATSGRRIAQTRFREIVDVSPPGVLNAGLLTQRDFSDGFYRHDPGLGLGRGFPENHHQYLVSYPGVRSHLIASRPLMVHGEKWVFPAGDLSNLRLFIAETPETQWIKNYSLDEPDVEHFRDMHEGRELEHGEPYPVDIWLDAQGNAAAPGLVSPAPATAGSRRRLDLIMVPGGIEFWFRMRTYPPARSEEGLLKLIEGGTEPDRNKIALLYDHSRGRVVFRLYDSSRPDPSMLPSRETGQFLQIEAYRQLFLDTWYHMRVLWDGVYGGGAQLYIDGIPSGSDNLSTELLTGIPANAPVATISVRDASRFPLEGVVRIDSELFEYRRAGNSALQVRKERASTWRPLPYPQGFNTGGDGQPGGRRGIGGGGRGGRRGAGGGGQGGAPDAAGSAAGSAVAPPGPDRSTRAPSTRSGGRAPGTGSGAPDAAGAAAPGAMGPLGLDRPMRAPYNRRGSVSARHAPGARVSLWGYSLQIRRKIRDERRNPQEFQLTEGSREVVWGPGGLRLLEPLPAFNFPPDVDWHIYHYIDLSVLQEPGPGGEPPPGPVVPPKPIIVPFFRMNIPGPPPGCPVVSPSWSIYLAQHPNPAYARNAIDYFQSRGVCRVTMWRQETNDEGELVTKVRERYMCYRKVPLPPEYQQAQQLDVCRVMRDNFQTMGLELEGEYRGEGGCSGDMGGWQLSGSATVVQLSLLANGPVSGLYPPTGVLEVEGVPSPWEIEAGRQPAGGLLFSSHPDDRVEWIRYVNIHNDMFVGRRSSRSNFRGYPARISAGNGPRRSWEEHVRQKKQLDHPPGAALRLVMELSQGGAGFGDYVTIASGDPRKFEPGLRRVYKTFEHEDGRFFVSLLDVTPRGVEIPNSPGVYRNAYFRGDNPRLVKFPTWGLPEVSSGGVLTLFGDAQILSGGSAPRGQRSFSRSQHDEEEEQTGIVLDEIRRLENRSMRRPDPTFGPQVRHVLAPLPVQFQQGSGLTGMIPPGRAVSPTSPLEVLVVAVSTEDRPSIFGGALEEGVLRIGSELFYFEDPSGEGQSTANVSAGGRLLGGSWPDDGGDDAATDQVQQPLTGPKERKFETRVTPGQIRVSGGRFERQGFARIRDLYPERRDFFEIFYYQGYSGGGFVNCLRGQFHTSILALGSAAAYRSPIHNITRRLRLIGRSLLGTKPEAHGVGDPVSLVPYLNMTPITGALTDTGIPVKDTKHFAREGGYVLVDPGRPGRPWEILAHLGGRGEGYLLRPRDERGKGCLRGRFGTPILPVSRGMFAYDLPFRYHSRYEPETESESLAYFQKAFRNPGAYWRTLDWLERPWKSGRDRLCDIVVAARFDGVPEWDAEPTNEKGGLYLFERKRRSSGEEEPFAINRLADEMEIRIYFRYEKGAFGRLREDIFNDDWKETPILESLTVEYEKDGRILRYEELPF